MTRSTKPYFKLHTIDTRFALLAQRPGGVTRDVAISAAVKCISAMPDDHQAILAAKVEQLMEYCGEGASRSIFLVEFDFLECLAEVRDVGFMVGFPAISKVAGQLCVLLDRTQGKSSSEALSCFLHSMMLCINPRYVGASPEAVGRLFMHLEQLTKKEISRWQEAA